MAHWMPAAIDCSIATNFEAQQMILAAASLVQLRLHGSVPQRAMMIREEKDTGRKWREKKS